MNFGKYIGIDYKHNSSDFSGCDCWGLYRLIFKEERNIILTSFVNTYKESWYKEKKNYIEESVNKTGFYIIDPPYKRYDGLIFYHGSKTIANHIGLWIGNNKFIHIYKGSTSMVGHFDKYKRLLYKTCRYIDLTKENLCH